MGGHAKEELDQPPSVVQPPGDVASTGTTHVRYGKQEHLAVPLVAGGLAGAAVKTIFSPLNAIAQRASYLRMQGAQNVSIPRVARTMVRMHGLGGFWKGNTLNCLGCIPSKGLKFLGYEVSKQLLTKNERQPTNAERLLSGAIAGATTVAVMYPMDTFNVRLTVGKTFSEVLNTVRGKSGLLSLYQGIGTSVLCTLPTVGISFAVYEGLQQEWRQRAGLSDDEPLGQLPSLCCAAAGTFLACTVAWPLNNVRKRMQMQALVEARVGRPVYSSAVNAFRTIVAKEGPLGLYVGWLPSISKNVPSMSLQLVAYDMFKKLLGHGQALSGEAATTPTCAAVSPAPCLPHPGLSLPHTPKSLSLRLKVNHRPAGPHSLQLHSTPDRCFADGEPRRPCIAGSAVQRHSKKMVLRAAKHTRMQQRSRVPGRVWCGPATSCWHEARRLWRTTIL